MLFAPQAIELFLHAQDFEFGSQIDLVVMGGRHPVFFGLPVLAHHDDRCLDRGEHREHQVEEDVGIGVEGAPLRENHAVDASPQQQEKEEDTDERPRATDLSHRIRHPIPESIVLFRLFGGVFADRRAPLDMIDGDLQSIRDAVDASDWSAAQEAAAAIAEALDQTK